MTNARQSIATLKDMLREASKLLAGSGSPPARSLARKIDDLLTSLDETEVVSAEAEHEIVSIYVLAEIERTRARTKVAALQR